ncbi:MAG: hypothetical protein AB7E29_13870 [Xanthobacter sp.]
MALIVPETEKVQLTGPRGRGSYDTYSRAGVDTSAIKLGEALSQLGGSFTSLAAGQAQAKEEADARNLEHYVGKARQEIVEGVPMQAQLGNILPEQSNVIRGRVAESLGFEQGQKWAQERYSEIMSDENLLMNPAAFGAAMDKLKAEAYAKAKEDPAYGAGYLKAVDGLANQASANATQLRTKAMTETQERQFDRDLMDVHDGNADLPEIGPQSNSGGTLATHRSARLTKAQPNVAKIIDEEAAAAGMDPTVLKTLADIESSGNPNAVTGSYKGVFQMSDGEMRRFGGGASAFDARANTRAAIASLKHKAAVFRQKHGRDPTVTEFYLGHQQGEGGLAAHLSNPSRLAWQSMASTGEGKQKGVAWAKQAIWGNVPSDMRHLFPNGVDGMTSAQFMAVWAQKVQGIPYEQALAQAQRGTAGMVAGNDPVPSMPPLSNQPIQVASNSVPTGPTGGVGTMTDASVEASSPPDAKPVNLQLAQVEPDTSDTTSDPNATRRQNQYRALDERWAKSGSLAQGQRRLRAVTNLVQAGVDALDLSYIEGIPPEWITPDLAPKVEKARAAIVTGQAARRSAQRQAREDERKEYLRSQKTDINQTHASGGTINPAQYANDPEAYEYALKRQQDELYVDPVWSQTNMNSAQTRVEKAALTDNWDDLGFDHAPTREEIDNWVDDLPDMKAADRIKLKEKVPQLMEMGTFVGGEEAKEWYDRYLGKTVDMQQSNPRNAAFGAKDYRSTAQDAYDTSLRMGFKAYVEDHGKVPSGQAKMDIYRQAVKDADEAMKRLKTSKEQRGNTPVQPNSTKRAIVRNGPDGKKEKLEGGKWVPVND